MHGCPCVSTIYQPSGKAMPSRARSNHSQAGRGQSQQRTVYLIFSPIIIGLLLCFQIKTAEAKLLAELRYVNHVTLINIISKSRELKLHPRRQQSPRLRWICQSYSFDVLKKVRGKRDICINISSSSSATSNTRLSVLPWTLGQFRSWVCSTYFWASLRSWSRFDKCPLNLLTLCSSLPMIWVRSTYTLNCFLFLSRNYSQRMVFCCL